MDRGIVIDVEARVTLIGLALAGEDARIVVASIETLLEHADTLAGMDRPSWRWVGERSTFFEEKD